MKRLILDHLKRWWWIWLFAGGVRSMDLAGSSVSKDSFQSFSTITFITLQIVYFAGVFPLSYDLQRGHSRALLALPVSTRQMARAWWFVSVGFPALLLAAAAGLTMWAHSMGTTNKFQTDVLLAGCLTNTLWLGAAFFLLTTLSGRQPHEPADYARRILLTGFILLCLFGVDWSGDFSLHTKKGVGLVLLALVMTIAGWSRAESLVIKRVGARDVGQARRKGKPQFQVQAGFGGLPFFVARIFTRCMLLGLFMVAFMVFIIVMTRHSRENLGGIDLIREGLSSLKNDFYIWWVLLIQLVPTVAHIRFLRTLPLSTLVLATTLVLVPTTAIVLLGGLIAVLAGTGSATDSIMSTYLIAASVGAVSVAVLVWRSADRDSMALFLFVMFFGFVVPMWFQADRTPLWVMISVVVSAVCLAIAITRRALMRSCHTYRVPPVNAWGMMMGWRS